MAAHKIKCFSNNCSGTPFVINDVAASWYLQKLAPIIRHPTSRR